MAVVLGVVDEDAVDEAVHEEEEDDVALSEKAIGEGEPVLEAVALGDIDALRDAVCRRMSHRNRSGVQA